MSRTKGFLALFLSRSPGMCNWCREPVWFWQRKFAYRSSGLFVFKSYALYRHASCEKAYQLGLKMGELQHDFMKSIRERGHEQRER